MTIDTKSYLHQVEVLNRTNNSTRNVIVQGFVILFNSLYCQINYLITRKSRKTGTVITTWLNRVLDLFEKYLCNCWIIFSKRFCVDLLLCVATFSLEHVYTFWVKFVSISIDWYPVFQIFFFCFVLRLKITVYEFFFFRWNIW